MLISVDTLRRDVISAYNPDARPTPRIDALIADGAQFTRAWVPSSWTLPSVVSMMTGVSPAVHQANDFGARIPGNLDTVAEEFRHRGYAAEAFVENLLLGPERGLSRGFDRYVHLPTLEPHPTLGQRLLTRVWPDRFIAEGGARGIVEMAWRRIRRHRTEKLFLWLHLLEPHAPYLPPPAFWPEGVPLDANHPDVSNGPIGGRVSREVLLNEMYPLYLAEVQYIDHCIGLLLDRMRRIGAYDRTAIVFTGDHGEEFGEQGRWGHGNTPVETLIHMPLSLKAPAVEPGSVDDRMVDTSGFPATMLHLADPSFRPAPHLVSAWSTDPPPRRDDESTTPTFVYSTSIPREGRHEDALVFGERPWKYVYDREGDSDRLYDLKFDPDETAPATEAHPDLLARGRELYHAHLREGARIREILDLAGRQDLEYSDDVVEELRKLGYVN
jgi:arylsulfatase A-like enzyme